MALTKALLYVSLLLLKKNANGILIDIVLAARQEQQAIGVTDDQRNDAYTQWLNGIHLYLEGFSFIKLCISRFVIGPVKHDTIPG